MNYVIYVSDILIGLTLWRPQVVSAIFPAPAERAVYCILLGFTEFTGLHLTKEAERYELSICFFESRNFMIIKSVLRPPFPMRCLAARDNAANILLITTVASICHFNSAHF